MSTEQAVKPTGTDDYSSGIHQTREVIRVPLSTLSLSAANMRKSKTIEPDFVESIKVNGVYQALTIDSENKVAAGRRRFNALSHLLSKKVINEDYLVPCVRVDDEQAALASIVENLHRQQPHPAQYYSAIVKLSKDPQYTKADICSMLQLTGLQYDQYMRLAGLHSKIFKAYAADILSDTQAKAFAATDNKKLQLQIWEKASFDPDIPVYTIKQAINGSLTSESPLLKFVTLDLYLLNKGKTTHDLFGDLHAIHDPDLAERLADQKLTEAMELFKEENPGWKWYDIASISSPPDTEVKLKLHGKYRKPSSEQKKILDDLAAKIEPLDDRRFDDLTSEEEKLLDDLCDQLDEAEHRINIDLEFYTKAQMKVSGVLVTFDDSGNLVYEKGSQTKDDIADEKAAAKKKQSTKSDQSDTTADAPVDPNKLSNALENDLRMSYRSFVKAELLKHPELAVELLNYSLIVSMIGDWTSKFNAISTRETVDETPTNYYSESKAALILEQAYKALPQDWMDTESDSEKFQSYLALRDSEKQQLLAYVSVLTLDDDLDNTIAIETDLNPRDYWTPNAQNYFGRISKIQVLDHIEELVGAKHRKQQETFKKSEAAQYAEDIFKGGQNTFETLKKWLPPFFKTM